MNIPTHEIFVRMTVRKIVHGPITHDKKHKAVRGARQAIEHRPDYTVTSAEVASVREVQGKC